MRIDAHLHFWRPSCGFDNRPIADNEAYRRDFLPADVRPAMIESAIDSAILVQTAPQVEETAWLLELAREIDWIAGITGWVDLDSEHVDYAPLVAEPKLVGIRAQLRRIADPGFVRRPRVVRNIGAALDAGIGVTLLAEHRHYEHVAAVLDELPAGPVTFNHLGMAFPDVPHDDWRRALRRFAQRPQTYMQLSGLPFLAGSNWQQPEAQRILDEVLEIFGPRRLLFASDWPMLVRFTDYQTWVLAVEGFVQRHTLGVDDVDAIFAGNTLAANPRMCMNDANARTAPVLPALSGTGPVVPAQAGTESVVPAQAGTQRLPTDVTGSPPARG